MNNFHTLDRTAVAAKRSLVKRFAALCSLLAALAGFTVPAHAVDGCKVLLSLAAPSWRSIQIGRAHV